MGLGLLVVVLAGALAGCLDARCRAYRRSMRRRASVVVGLGFLAGCLEPRLTRCGDDWCVDGATCVIDRCVSAAQLDACLEVPDGSACNVGGATGHCAGGACFVEACGNQVVDLGEVCDDGNATSGDGCRADCRKLEVCGDAMVDDGEGCDDGNANPADRCDACSPTTWHASVVIGGSGNATDIGLKEPSATAVDRHGNVYLADSSNHRIRRIDIASRVITTIAGTGTSGFGGDGGAATNARLFTPSGLAVDGHGNVYFSDQFNHRIRRVDDATGIITTVAGIGPDGLPTFGGFGGDGGMAINAQLNRPTGVAIDGLGNVYFSDAYNHRVRRIDATTGVITTVAGTGSAGFAGDGGPATSAQLQYPDGVAVNGDDVYVSDSLNDRIRRVDATGVITTIAGSGTRGLFGDGDAATLARLAYPGGVALDSLGNVYIADAGNDRIRRVDVTTGVITTLAGIGMIGQVGGFSGDGSAATAAQLFSPTGTAIDSRGNVYISDRLNHRIRRVDAVTGIITTVAGTGTSRFAGDGGAATSAQLASPYGVVIDGLGNVVVADGANHRIRRIDVTSGIMTTIAGTGATLFGGDGGAATSASVFSPFGVAIDGSGNLYLTDTHHHRIRRVDVATGIITTVAGTGSPSFGGDGGVATSARLQYPAGIAVDGLGNLYVADTNNHRIRRVDATTRIITTVAGTGTVGFGGDDGAGTSALLNFPGDVAIDGAGNVYIADTKNHRIRRLDPGGIITTVAGTGTGGFAGGDAAQVATSAQIRNPQGVAIDDTGNLYIADTYNDRVRRVDVAGVITTVAGSVSGATEFGGDGGPATSAAITHPHRVVVDDLGNIIFSDNKYNRIRRIDGGTGTITTIGGQVDPDGMGPVAQARFADPRALVIPTPGSQDSFTLVAGGGTGTVQALRPTWLEVVAGRYPQPTSIGVRARFRDQTFGSVGGIAYDAAARRLYLTESSSNRLDVVDVVDPGDATTWTIAPFANASGAIGFADGAILTARFRNPTGLYLDATTHELYVADTGNHVIRAIDLSSGTVRTIAGVPSTLGLHGDGGLATAALLFQPQAITRCSNGDLFVADTGSHRVRRVSAGVISTVLGVSVAASSGEGHPASSFPVQAPLGLACDAIGNLFVTSTATVRLLPADDAGVVDGSGPVQTIYGPPDDAFPASVTTCLTGIAVVDATTTQVTDSCTGLLVELRRMPK